MSKEIQCKCCKEYWWEMNIHKTSGLCPNCYDYVADLEAKLAESEKEKENYKMGYTGKVWKSQEDKIDQLKQQLAEKEKENAKLKEVVDCVDKLKQFNADMKDYALVNRDVADEIYFEHQDKISFAVEQLEKVKDIIYRFDVSYDEINNLTIALNNYTNGFHKAKFKATILIDNQIKQLKKGETK